MSAVVVPGGKQSNRPGEGTDGRTAIAQGVGFAANPSDDEQTNQQHHEQKIDHPAQAMHDQIRAVVMGLTPLNWRGSHFSHRGLCSGGR